MKKQLAMVVVLEVSKNKKEEEVAIDGGGGFRSFEVEEDKVARNGDDVQSFK